MSVCVPGGTSGKDPASNAGDVSDAGSIPALGRSPGEGNGSLLQDSCPGNTMDRAARQTTVHRVAESLT